MTIEKLLPSIIDFSNSSLSATQAEVLNTLRKIEDTPADRQANARKLVNEEVLKLGKTIAAGLTFDECTQLVQCILANSQSKPDSMDYFNSVSQKVFKVKQEFARAKEEIQQQVQYLEFDKEITMTQIEEINHGFSSFKGRFNQRRVTKVKEPSINDKLVQTDLTATQDQIH